MDGYKVCGVLISSQYTAQFTALLGAIFSHLHRWMICNRQSKKGPALESSDRAPGSVMVGKGTLELPKYLKSTGESSFSMVNINFNSHTCCYQKLAIHTCL